MYRKSNLILNSFRWIKLTTYLEILEKLVSKQEGEIKKKGTFNKHLLSLSKEIPQRTSELKRLTTSHTRVQET